MNISTLKKFIDNIYIYIAKMKKKKNCWAGHQCSYGLFMAF